MNSRTLVRNIFDEIGIEFGKEIQIHNDRFYDYLLHYRSLGLGESYMAGWWDTDNFPMLMQKLQKGLPKVKHYFMTNLRLLGYPIIDHMINRQNKWRAIKNVRSHYDIGNELYEIMLDEHMVYSCAYFKNDNWNLEKAQEAKVDLVYRKLHLPDQDVKNLRILDIGCGWGYAACYGAQKYGIECTGITLSLDQFNWAQKGGRGLPVKFILQDYRDLQGKEQFDAIFSIGMFEHVGRKNFRPFMQSVYRLLKDGGLFLLHTIGAEENGPIEPWLNKYIFPSAYIPSIGQISQAAKGLLVMQDLHNFSQYYPKTLNNWRKRFEEDWPKLQEMRPDFYTDSFYRMWQYYLQLAAFSFLGGRTQLWQIVFTKGYPQHVYQAIR